MTDVKMVLMAAVDENNLIGRDNDLPWKIKEDLKFFKATTTGHTMLMGYNTWKSFGARCLPKRHHVIVTSNPARVNIHPEDSGMLSISSCLDIAISIARSEARKKGQDRFYVIGGGSIYGQTIDRADELLLTRVWDDFGHQFGDVRFPTIDPKVWKLEEEGERFKTDYEFTLGERYVRAQ